MFGIIKQINVLYNQLLSLQYHHDDKDKLAQLHEKIISTYHRFSHTAMVCKASYIVIPQRMQRYGNILTYDEYTRSCLSIVSQMKTLCDEWIRRGKKEDINTFHHDLGDIIKICEEIIKNSKSSLRS